MKLPRKLIVTVTIVDVMPNYYRVWGLTDWIRKMGQTPVSPVEETTDTPEGGADSPPDRGGDSTPGPGDELSNEQQTVMGGAAGLGVGYIIGGPAGAIIGAILGAIISKEEKTPEESIDRA